MHLIFIILHIVAICFGFVFLIITIPTHAIYSAITSGRNDSKPNYRTHVHCPDCRELVIKGANICKHCRCALVPQ